MVHTLHEDHHVRLRNNLICSCRALSGMDSKSPALTVPWSKRSIFVRILVSCSAVLLKITPIQALKPKATSTEVQGPTCLLHSKETITSKWGQAIPHHKTVCQFPCLTIGVNLIVVLKFHETALVSDSITGVILSPKKTLLKDVYTMFL